MTGLNLSYDEAMRLPLRRKEIFLTMLAEDWKRQVPKKK